MSTPTGQIQYCVNEQCDMTNYTSGWADQCFDTKAQCETNQDIKYCISNQCSMTNYVPAGVDKSQCYVTEKECNDAQTGTTNYCTVTQCDMTNYVAGLDPSKCFTTKAGCTAVLNKGV